MTTTLNFFKPKSKKQLLSELRTTVFTFANRLMEFEPDLTQSQAFRIAWHEVKTSRNKMQYIEFETVTRSICKRIIKNENWSDSHTVNGTGKPTKPGQVLYTDYNKWFSDCKIDTGSYYKNNLRKVF